MHYIICGTVGELFICLLKLAVLYYHFQIESTMSTQFTIVYIINIIESKIVCLNCSCCFSPILYVYEGWIAGWLASSFRLMRFIKSFSIRLLWRYILLHNTYFMTPYRHHWVEKYFTTKMSNDERIFSMHACGMVDVWKRMSVFSFFIHISTHTLYRLAAF